jgi:hypothetical protein
MVYHYVTNVTERFINLTISFMAGRRIQGLDADRTATQLPAGSVGGWVELARTTLGSAGDNIDVTSLPDKRYYMILTNGIGSASGFLLDRYRLNSDTGSNYASRYNDNGGADSTTTSSSEGMLLTGNSLSGTGELFTVGYIVNYSTKEKLMIGHTVQNDTAGAGTAPDRGEGVGKHAQTSNPISSVNTVNTNSGDFNTGSETVVLGYDPADTHTTNFWEELASVDLSGGASTSLSTGTFTAKKYLWIQLYAERNGGGAQQPILRVGNNTVDTGSNYAFRWTQNGAADATYTSRAYHGIGWGNLEHQFHNIFMVNNATEEKLIISHGVGRNGSGANVSPDRVEYAGKWANTSNQINIIELLEQDGFTFGTKTKMKVWGAD